MNLDKNRSIIVCGVGFQTETIIDYLKSNGFNITCILTDAFTKKPENCYLIPSKRSATRNSFSEVDMMLDDSIKGVSVKRYDMLSEQEKKALIVYYQDDESINAYRCVNNRKEIDSYQLTQQDLETINSEVWNSHHIINELWKTNEYLYSEVEKLKNCMRRQLRFTPYDFHFEFHLVEHCNLKCAGCTHFSSIAKEEFANLEEFKRDIFRLSELTGKVSRFINLLGGEPLLHPQINDFFDISRAAFPDTIIRVVTNGIKLLDMNSDFWESCRKNNIIIGITQYPINVNYESVFRKIEAENVKYENFNGENLPRDEMWRLSLNSDGCESPLDNFINCPRANACIFVSHGKVFNCATMANIKHFNECFGTNYQISKDDFVDIYNCDSIDEILGKLCNPKPFCRYCSVGNRQYGLKWTCSRKLIDEWT